MPLASVVPGLLSSTDIADMTNSPGALRSGLMRPSRVGPRLEKSDSVPLLPPASAPAPVLVR